MPSYSEASFLSLCTQQSHTGLRGMTEVGTAVLSTSTSGGVFYGYRSAVDNKTADPTFIAIQ